MNKFYQVRDPVGSQEVLLIAPLKILRQIFKLHNEAVRRIEEETKDCGECHIHFNGRTTPFTTSGSVFFQRYEGELP